MGEHLAFGDHLTPAPFDNRIRGTYLGQAHIAGTGPAGTTCRECMFWRLFGKRKQGGHVVEYVKDPAYFGKKHSSSPCELKKQRCTRPILNKANRLIPHYAPSCRLFEAAEKAPPIKRADAAA